MAFMKIQIKKYNCEVFKNLVLIHFYYNDIMTFILHVQYDGHNMTHLLVINTIISAVRIE